MPSSDTLTLVAVYGLPLLLVWSWYALRRRQRTAVGQALSEDSRRAGLMEPASLHPEIDPSLCLGCRTCVTACPESDVLAIVHGKASLVSPASCIGHGACREACPQDAITLVLGTASRGVEIPRVGPDFQTNVPGIYVAGELGGMGLIRNAIEQGRQAVEAIAAHPGVGGSDESDELDLVVIGAGPAGIAASLMAKASRLRWRTLEQSSLGGTVAHYPRGKIVMTRPAELPLYGKIELRETTKESLLELWSDVEQDAELGIRYGERVESIERRGDGFRVHTTAAAHDTKTVLLAIGRRGTPRQLGVVGEERTKVVYSLIDPAQYRGQRVLVVGGGDSALEAALAVADEPDTEVTLSYRSKAISRAKAKNRARFEAAVAAGRIRALLGSEVVQINEDSVSLTSQRGPGRLKNDVVIVCAGGVLPTEFLRACGIEVRTVHGEVMDQ